MPCLASFFDAMSGVKKLTNFIPVITYPTLANEPSNIDVTGLRPFTLLLYLLVSFLYLLVSLMYLSLIAAFAVPYEYNVYNTRR